MKWAIYNSCVFCQKYFDIDAITADDDDGGEASINLIDVTLYIRHGPV